MLIEKGFDLNKISYIKIGPKAKELILAEKKEELFEIIEKNPDIFLLGNCSNILFTAKCIDRVFLSLKNMKYIEEVEKGLIEIGGGTSFSEVVGYVRKKDYSGVEELAGIPGSAGGLTVMNAGAYKKEIFDIIEEVEIFDRDSKKIEWIKKQDIKYSYRSTEFQSSRYIITAIKIKLTSGFDSLKVMDIMNKRKNAQPLDYPNIGSIFKNPPSDFAARLIEECGLKGIKDGDAEISKKHSNFIINKGNASDKNVLNLINLIKEEVLKKFKINLEEEIIII